MARSVGSGGNSRSSCNDSVARPLAIMPRLPRSSRRLLARRRFLGRGRRALRLVLLQMLPAARELVVDALQMGAHGVARLARVVRLERVANRPMIGDGCLVQRR